MHHLPVVHKLHLSARPEDGVLLGDQLDAAANAFQLPDALRKKIRIVADEIFSNIVQYAYPAGDGDVDVEFIFVSDPPELQLRFSDSGIAYNPLETPEPDITLPPEERPLGGLGVFLVRKLMDRVDYSRINDHNILLLTKKLPPLSM